MSPDAFLLLFFGLSIFGTLVLDALVAKAGRLN